MPDLTNLERVKRYIRYDSDSTGDDNLIRQIITSVSQSVTRYLNRHIIASERTEQYNVGRNQYVFSLKGYPVDSSETLEFRDDFNREFTASAIDSDTYHVDDASGLVTFDSYVPQHGPGTLQAIYTGGLATSVLTMTATVSGMTGTIAIGDALSAGTSDAQGTATAAIASGGTSASFTVNSGFFEAADVVSGSSGSFTISTIDTTPLVSHEKYGAIVGLVEQQVLFDYRNRNNVGLLSVGAEGGSRGFQVAPGSLHPAVKKGLRQFRRDPAI